MLGDVWNEADNAEFGKVMTGRQAIRRDAILAHPTLQSHKRCVVADSEKEGDNNSLSESAVDNDYPLPSQPIPSHVVPIKISSLLTDISRANTSPLPEAFKDPDQDFSESAKTNQPGSSPQSRSKSGVIKCVDYKHPQKPRKALLVTHNVFHAKRIPQSHTHMVGVLSVLDN